VSKLANYLNQYIVGNVFDRPSICRQYSTDRSILQISPRLVVFPESSEDIQALLRFTNQLAMRNFRLPVTLRGTGLDKTGAAIGDGLIISTEKLNHIEELDLRGRLVRAQPGVTLGQLNSALALQGLTLPIDYDPRATLGGLIANCPNDDISDKYGGVFHYIERAEVVLSNGDLIQLGPMTARNLAPKLAASNFEGALYRRLTQLLDRHGDTIVNRTMSHFDAAGYANVTKIREQRVTNLLPLMFASQGTLAVISDVILRVEPLPSATRHLAVTLPDAKALLRFLNFVQELDPRSLKFYDLRIVQEAAKYGNQPILLNPEFDRGWLVIVSFDNHKWRLNKNLQHCLDVLPPGTFAIEENLENHDAFSEFYSALMSFLNDNQAGERAPVADDVYVPNFRLEDFFAGLHTLEETLSLDLPMFGSFSTSNYNVRPLVDLSSLDGRKLAITFLRQYSDLVISCEGSLTGGSPEGRVKSLSTSGVLSDAELKLYREIKAAFDPNNILNPDVKLGADLKDTLRHLRTTERAGLQTP